VTRQEGMARLWIGSLAIPAERAVGQSGFRPALRMSSRVIAGMRWLKVAPAEDAEAGLVDSAREVLAVGGRPLRLATTMRRAHPLRH
jgi:hypothetical protein